jgi:hypothetical protein
MKLVKVLCAEYNSKFTLILERFGIEALHRCCTMDARKGV